MAFAAALAPRTASSQSWWNTSWRAKRKITFNNSAQSQNLTSFPVLVKLDASRIDHARTQNAGEDLRFVDADDATVLDREIEEEFLSYV